MKNNSRFLEYLNRNYLKNENLEYEVITMTKTLYDPAVKEEGIKEGIQQEKIEMAKNLLDILDNETISAKTGLSIEEVKKLRKLN